MLAIIQNEYCIGSIHQVLHNTMIKRYVHNDQKGRYSDCLVYVLSGKTKYFSLFELSAAVYPTLYSFNNF